MEKLSNISNIKNILSRYGFTFSKSLGQNFLINPSVCPKMAQNSGAKPGVGIIEIGPGIGVLTCELARLADKVVAIELDRRLIPLLDETLADFDNVRVINEDVLKVDIKKLIAKEFGSKPVCVCANLPYYITSPIIMYLLESRLPIDSITVMVQKEAAQRICAKAGTRQSSALTVAVNYYAKAKTLFHVSSGSFIPAPKVDSTVIKLDINKAPSVKVNDERLFFRVVRASFGQRRKNIANSLSSGLNIEKSKVINILSSCGISTNDRAEQLSIEDFALISNTLLQQKIFDNNRGSL